MATERTAVLILRAWSVSQPSGLRASIRHTSAAGTGLWHTVHLADSRAVERFISTWLREMDEAGPLSPPPAVEDEAVDGAAP